MANNYISLSSLISSMPSVEYNSISWTVKSRRLFSKIPPYCMSLMDNCLSETMKREIGALGDEMLNL